MFWREQGTPPQKTLNDKRQRKNRKKKTPDVLASTAMVLAPSRIATAAAPAIAIANGRVCRYYIRRHCGGVLIAEGQRSHSRYDPIGDTMRRCLPQPQRRWPSSLRASSSSANSAQEESRGKNASRSNCSVKLLHDGGIVDVDFGDDTPSSPFHASWLWSNDPQRVHLPSGQRKSTPGEYRSNNRPRIASASIVYCYASNGGIVHNVEEDPTEHLPFPGPTMGDCCHPLATYGGEGRKAWMSSRASSLHGEITMLGAYLRVEWMTTSTISTYDMEWLNRFRYDDESRIKRKKHTDVTPLHALRKVGPPLWYTSNVHSNNIGSSTSSSKSSSPPSSLIYESDGLVHIDYRDITGEDKMTTKSSDNKSHAGLFQLLQSVFRDGAAIVANAPSPCHEEGLTTSSANEYPVAKVAMAMSGGCLSHGSLYGDVFHVRDNPANNNVAYTSLALCPHQDLAYYESPPGMQLLHCVANDTQPIRRRRLGARDLLKSLP